MFINAANLESFRHSRNHGCENSPRDERIVRRHTMSLLDLSYDYGKSPLDSNSYSRPSHIYLFGGHLSYSRSPHINSFLFKLSGIPWTYELRETTDSQRFLDVVHQPQCIGASITMPNKVTFMPLLDHLTEEALAIGAVNTVFIRLGERGERRYIGTNTDCVGIRETLLQNSPRLAETAAGHPALVIGAGGAARAAIYALWKWFSSSEIYVLNRLKTEVEDLVSSMKKSIPGIKIHHIESVREAELAEVPRIIVGTVPDHQPREPGEILAWHICEVLLRKRVGEGSVLDMCYDPVRTRLLDAAEKGGWTTMSGLEVLVRVNVAQQTLWLEREPRAEDVDRVFLSLQPASKL